MADRAGYPKEVGDAGLGGGSVVEHEVSFGCLTRKAPGLAALRPPQNVAVVGAVHYANGLHPDIEAEAVLRTQLNDAKPLRMAGPVVNPADDPVALARVVPVGGKTARPILELDADPPTGAIGDAVGKPLLDPLDPQAETPTGEMREEEDDALLVLRRVIERSVVETRGANSRARDSHGDRCYSSAVDR